MIVLILPPSEQEVLSCYRTYCEAYSLTGHSGGADTHTYECVLQVSLAFLQIGLWIFYVYGRGFLLTSDRDSYFYQALV